jgi:hypothetical protein
VASRSGLQKVSVAEELRTLPGEIGFLRGGAGGNERICCLRGSKATNSFPEALTEKSMKELGPSRSPRTTGYQSFMSP